MAKPRGPPGPALRLSVSTPLGVQRDLRFSAQLKAKCLGGFAVMAVSFTPLGQGNGLGHG